MGQPWQRLSAVNDKILLI